MNTFKEENVENPYRYGALVGNWVEERFGRELASRPQPQPNFLTCTQAFHSVHSTIHNSNSKEEEKEFDSRKVNQQGVDRHLFFGHGSNQNDFENRELRTNYELSMDNKIPAHVGADSTYAPPPMQARPKEEAKTTTGHQVKPKSYNEFTKRCDATFNKTGLRK